MRLSKPSLVIAAIVAILVTIYFARRAISSDPNAVLARLGDVELPTDSAYVRWYTQGAKCLGLTQPYDRRVRYFAGHTTPASWNAKVSDKTQAHTDLDSRAILFDPYYAHDSLVVLHELVHIALHDAHHPQQYFGVAIAKKCGLTPGKDR